MTKPVAGNHPRHGMLGCGENYRGKGLVLCSLLGLMLFCGCDKGPVVVPVTGKVTYQGKPLEFGSVTFQPRQGQPARGEIQPDGTFSLSSYAPGDGAVIGTHKVRIACYTSQKKTDQQPVGEQSLGKLLIPRKYTLFDYSGLTAEVKADGNNSFEFNLTDD